MMDEEDDAPSFWSRCVHYVVYNLGEGKKLPFVFAISAIILFQFQEPLIRWFTYFVCREDASLWDSFCELLLVLSDYAQAYAQMGAEMLRSMRAWDIKSKEEEEETDALTARSSISRRRRRRDIAGIMSSVCSSMPELEVLSSSNLESSVTPNAFKNSVGQSHSVVNDDAKEPASDVVEAAATTNPIATHAQTSNDSSLLQKNGHGKSTQALWEEEPEPAFLNESDYPPGWMVYHPILGVVLKTKADQYDRDRKLHSCRDDGMDSSNRVTTHYSEQPQQQAGNNAPVLQPIVANG